MDQQGRHCHDSTGDELAILAGLPTSQLAQLLLAQQTKQVRSRYDLKRAVGPVAVIQVHSQSDAALQDSPGRDSMIDPRFQTPAAISSGVYPGLDWNSGVLVPVQLPIGIPSLVQHYRLIRFRSSADRAFGHPKQHRGVRQPAYFLIRKERENRSGSLRRIFELASPAKA